jgi:Right handed beta helix region
VVRASLLACLLLVIGLLAMPAAAASAVVYPGCQEPAAKPGGRSFYVDPVHGSSQGEGSRAHPWRTLEQVVHDGLFLSTPRRGGGGPAEAGARVGKAAAALVLGHGPPIRGGDTVYLMSGDHGAVTLQGYFGHELEGYANDDFITIAAAPGQTPVLRQLKLIGGAKWVFRGLTFQSLNPNPDHAAGGSNVKDYFLVSLTGPHDNIVLDRNHFLSATDVSNWGMQDWITKRVSGVLDYQGACVALTNNTLENIGTGLQTQSSSKVLIQGNVIDHFADDGMDFGSSELLIANNRITNSVEDGDGIHRDGMQGQPNLPTSVLTDVTIRDNTVIRLLDPSLRFPAYLQGIDAFDGVWRNVKITGNVVITDANQGISFYGGHGLVISHNALLGDSGKLLPCGSIKFEACLAATVVTDIGRIPPRIVAEHGKDGSPSSDVVISKNITSALDIDVATVGVQIIDNLCTPSSERNCMFGYPVGATKLWAGKPGRYPGNNVIADYRPSDLFVAYDPVGLKYDLRRRKASGDASTLGPGF